MIVGDVVTLIKEIDDHLDNNGPVPKRYIIHRVIGDEVSIKEEQEMLVGMGICGAEIVNIKELVKIENVSNCKTSCDLCKCNQ